MLLIPCPHCGPRPEIEFRCCGEAHLVRPAAAEASEVCLAQYLYIRSNQKGVRYERWRHIHGCARFFNVVRDTVSDRIEMSYEAGQPRPASHVDVPP